MKLEQQVVGRRELADAVESFGSASLGLPEQQPGVSGDQRDHHQFAAPRQCLLDRGVGLTGVIGECDRSHRGTSGADGKGEAASEILVCDPEGNVTEFASISPMTEALNRELTIRRVHVSERWKSVVDAALRLP